MKPISSRTRTRGTALVAALALVVISSVLLWGMVTLVTSYTTRQRRESDYAAALQMAEAGINFEIRHIGVNKAVHAIGTPGQPTGVTGFTDSRNTFKVWAEKPSGGVWAAGDDALITSVGTIGFGTTNPVTRTVQVVAKNSGGSGGGTSIFASQYAVFAYKKLLFLNNSSIVNGNMGVNGPAPGSGYSMMTQSNGVGNANASGKPLTLAGGASLIPGNSVNPNYTNNPQNINVVQNNITWPTVDQVAAAAFPNGWNSINTTAAVQAQWAKVRMYKTQGRQMTAAGTKPINTVTNTSTILNDNCVRTYAEDGQPTNCIIFPPGDYYFTRVQLTSSGFAGPAPVMYIDTEALSTGGTPGPVRFWMSGTDSAADYFKSEIRYTSTVTSRNAQYSRIFYNKANTLSFNGNGIYAGVYAVKVGAGTATTYATISLDPSAKFWGTIIADNVTMQGGVDIYYLDTNSNASDYTFGGSAPGAYGFASDWKEVLWRDPTTPATVRGAKVFGDGTDR